jgi:DNA-binding response OmpR family regulator
MKAILFVDDNEILCRLACDILRREGFQAVGAFNAVDALAAFDKQSFDLVITDWRMEGMDGLEMAREIRKTHPALPVIMVTAYDLVEAEEITECLKKETLFPTLVERVRAHLKVPNHSGQRSH